MQMHQQAPPPAMFPPAPQQSGPPGGPPQQAGVPPHQAHEHQQSPPPPQRPSIVADDDDDYVPPSSNVARSGSSTSKVPINPLSNQVVVMSNLDQPAAGENASPNHGQLWAGDKNKGFFNSQGDGGNWNKDGKKGGDWGKDKSWNNRSDKQGWGFGKDNKGRGSSGWGNSPKGGPMNTRFDDLGNSPNERFPSDREKRKPKGESLTATKIGETDPLPPPLPEGTDPVFDLLADGDRELYQSRLDGMISTNKGVDVTISKALTYILRHHSEELNIKVGANLLGEKIYPLQDRWNQRYQAAHLLSWGKGGWGIVGR